MGWRSGQLRSSHIQSKALYWLNDSPSLHLDLPEEKTGMTTPGLRKSERPPLLVLITQRSFGPEQPVVLMCPREKSFASASGEGLWEMLASGFPFQAQWSGVAQTQNSVDGTEQLEKSLYKIPRKCAVWIWLEYEPMKTQFTYKPNHKTNNFCIFKDFTLLNSADLSNKLFAFWFPTPVSFVK